MQENKGKVVVGISGGVDSSVTAYLLKQAGYEVIGVTMQTLEKDDPCYNPSILEDAKRVAEDLGIPFHVIDVVKQFDKCVIQNFADEYLNGRTPNPCIVCNRHVKWEALLEGAELYGADFVATGHYAEIATYPETGRYTFKMPTSFDKDQTYMLYNLTQKQLSRTMMPLWNYEKNEVRKIAEEAGIPVANKPDSQEICFVADDDYASYIQRYITTDSGSVPGNFVDEEGNVLGQHKGILYYTVGQRKGLGIAFGKPMYVLNIRPSTNEVVLTDNESLFRTEMLFANVNYMGMESISEESITVQGKIRYGHKPTDCKISLFDKDAGIMKCVFDQPQRAITPGQSAVFYKDGYVLCGGIILA